MNNTKVEKNLRSLKWFRDHLYEYDLGTNEEEVSDILANAIDAIEYLRKQTQPTFVTTMNQMGNNCSFIGSAEVGARSGTGTGSSACRDGSSELGTAN